MRLTLLFISLVLLTPLSTRAADLFVDHQRGNDENSGKKKSADDKNGPFRTINRALEVCKPGDTIHLAKTDTVYHQDIEIPDGLSGTPEKPIIIDGHGATLSGCTTIRPAEWTHLGNGLYRNDRLLPDIFPRKQPVNESLLWRFFFLFNGEMVRMGRSGKGDHPPLPTPSALKPGEWTYDDAEMAFFVRIDPSRKLADERIEYPDLINGLKTSDGQSEHFVIRNLTMTHFHNDGFNINGATRHYKFENVQAIECGDDGMSAHTASEIEVDGFVSRGNSTGFCHVQGASSISRRVELRDNHAFDVLVSGWGTHQLSECLIRPNHGQIRVVRVSSEGAEAGKRCTLQMEKVWIDGDAIAKPNVADQPPDPDHQMTLEVVGSCDLTVSKTRLSSISIVSRWPGGGVGKIKFVDSIIAGQTPPRIELLPDTIWNADWNRYGVTTLSISGERYEHAQWERYRKRTGQDANSTWQAVSR